MGLVTWCVLHRCGSLCLVKGISRLTYTSDLKGEQLGPKICDGLKKTLGYQTVACQGVGGPYKAYANDSKTTLATSTPAVLEAQRLIKMAYNACDGPGKQNTSLLLGGYGQGAAVIQGALFTSYLNITANQAPYKQISHVILYAAAHPRRESPYLNISMQRICAAHDSYCFGGGRDVAGATPDYSVVAQLGVDSYKAYGVRNN